MNSENRTRQSVIIMGSSFILPLIVVGIILAANNITPFGSRNLLVGDMGAQYSPFFTALRHALLTGHMSWFSFSVGVGENIFSLVAYYLLGPFNLIILLFSSANVPTAVTIILMLKIATMALTMSFYLIHHFHRVNWIVPFFALAFSLSGFVTANLANIMWLDGLICLPLICHGIDQIKAGHRSYQLFAWLTIAIITNFYIGYMIGLFTIIYTITLIIAAKQPEHSLTKTLNENGPFIRSVIGTEFLSVMTTMTVLLPVALGMIQTAKVAPASPTQTAGTRTPQFGLEILSQFGMGGTAYSNRLYHAPAIFSSIAIIILFISYFAHPSLSHQEKVGTGFAFGSLFLSMIIGPINLIWHMLNVPSGSPFRYSFLISFVMIAAAYQVWLAHPTRLSDRAKWFIPIGISFALLIGFETIKIGTVTYHNTYLSVQPASVKLLLLNLTLVLLFSILIFANHHRLFTTTIGGFIALEMGGNLAYVVQSEPLGNQRTYASGFNAETQQLSSVSEPQTHLFRIDNRSNLLAPAFSEIYLGYNDPTAFQYAGIQEYSSTLHEPVRESLKELGFFSKNQRRISNVGATAISDLLLGVKYNLAATQTPKLNSAYVGMGFPVTKQFVDLKLKPGRIFANLASTLKTIEPSSDTYLTHQKIRRKTVSRSSLPGLYHATFTIDPTHQGPLYLTTTSPVFRMSSLTVNGHQVDLVTNGLHKKYLVKLGTASVGHAVHIVITGASQKTLRGIQVQSLNVQSLTHLTNQLRSEAFIPTYNGNHIQGTIKQSNRQSKWAYIAIPDDSGWSAAVNGRQVVIHNALGAFMAIPLTATINHISMTYHVPGLFIGLCLSLLGLSGYGLWITMSIYQKKLKRKDGR